MNAKQTPLVDILRLHAEDLYSDYGHNKSARLLSQAADEIQRLRAKLESTTEDRDLWKRSAQRLARDIEAVRAERAVLAGDGWKEWRA